MAVYKREGSPFYWFEFQLRGIRFRGSTEATTEREARAVERIKRQEAKQESERHEALGRAPMTWSVAAGRYWEWHGKHHKPDTGTWRALEWLTDEIGPATPLSGIDDRLVARLVAKRRGDGVKPATVNRGVVEPLRRVLNRARLWGEPLALIEWRKHLLTEPRERVRELSVEEEARLFAALRPDLHPAFRFALLTGCRLGECVGLRWRDINWGDRTITIRAETAKGGKAATIPMPPAVREVLWPLQGHHPESVFTYVLRHPGLGVLGTHRPLTYRQLERTSQLTIKVAGLMNFSFHDIRHTAASRLLRTTGNLNLVKRLLRHESIQTTLKYAHSLHGDVLDGMQAMADAYGAAEAHEVPTKGPHSKVSKRPKAHI
jgi:integrase